MENSNNAAFACASENGHQPGLTKREYFAGLAMQGLLAGSQHQTSRQEIAISAINYADELLTQLEKTNHDTSS